MARLNVVRAGTVLGYPVRNRRGEPLGRVEEVVVDSENGRVVYAILSFKELFGTEEKLFAVPWRALSVAPEEGALVLDVERDRLSDAPAFPREQWPDLGDAAWGARVYRYYHDDDPYWVAPRERTVAREPVPERTDYVDYRRTRVPSAMAWVAIVVALAVVLIVTYTMYPRETEIAADSLGRGAERAAATVKETSEDAATTFKVKAALALSKRVSAFAVDVDSDDGVVTLEGEVPSEGVKQVAAAIAWDTAGVTSVVNRLLVTPTAMGRPETGQTPWRVTDVEARVAVREALQEDPELAAQPLRVEVKDGIVTLTGHVESDVQRHRAEEIAGAVPGVREVLNRIQTTGTPGPDAIEPGTIPETEPGTPPPPTSPDEPLAGKESGTTPP